MRNPFTCCYGLRSSTMEEDGEVETTIEENGQKNETKYTTPTTPVSPWSANGVSEVESITSEERGEFRLQYKLGKEIGYGGFSTVREALNRESNQIVAAKCVPKEDLNDEDIEALYEEVEILGRLNHPHVLKFHDFISEPTHYYIVTDYMEGGELFDRIVSKTFYSEREARDLVKILLQTVAYIHDQGIVHRDLKPENLLLRHKNDDSSIQIADFGFATHVSPDEPLTAAFGTPGYIAPEVIVEGGEYGKPVDIWAMGVITYTLLCGYLPFFDDDQKVLFKMIRNGNYVFDSPYWDNISDDAKDFISKMLVIDPTKRLTSEELLKHKWILTDEVPTVLLSSTIEELKRFNARRKFKAAVNTVQVALAMRKSFGNMNHAQKLFTSDTPIGSVA